MRISLGEQLARSAAAATAAVVGWLLRLSADWSAVYAKYNWQS